MGSCLSSPAAEDNTKSNMSKNNTSQGATTGSSATKSQGKASIALKSKYPKSSLKGEDAIKLASARVQQVKGKRGKPHHKKGATTTSGSAAAAGSGGDEPLTDINNELLWAGSISIGTPAYNITVDFDTGSSDLFVNPNTFKPASSSTAKDTGKTFEVGYGDGTQASGEVWTDKVTVGGLTAPAQAVGVASKSTLQDDGSQGIAGMAFPSIAQTKSSPFFDSIYTANKSSIQNLFAFGLWTSNAVMDLGYIDDSRYTGTITYASVDDSQGFWQTDFTVNGTAANGIVDTGTTLIIGPTEDVRSILTAAGMTIQEQDGEVYGLYDPSTNPKVTFNFGGADYTLSPDALSFQTQGSQTVASIIGSDMGSSGPQWICGDSFLQDVYAVFDVQNKRVGFAPKKQ